MKELRFVKENGRWYIDIPEWEGTKEELEMVSGADDLLDYFAKGKDSIVLEVGETYDHITKMEGSIMLTKQKDLDNGADYTVINNHDIPKIWLCDVTKYVYGYMPKELYIQVKQ